jgi:hypothetical protein
LVLGLHVGVIGGIPSGRVEPARVAHEHARNRLRAEAVEGEAAVEPCVVQTPGQARGRREQIGEEASGKTALPELGEYAGAAGIIGVTQDEMHGNGSPCITGYI